MRRIPMSVSVALAAALLSAAPAAAQRGPADSGGAALAVGPRLLVDFESNFLTLGGEIRFAPAWPDVLQARAIYDFTFVDGLTERTFLLDALFTTGGFAVGGGPVIRNTRIELDSPRENLQGWSAVLMLGGDPRTSNWFTAGVELRFLWVDRFEPRTLGVAVGFPLF